MRTHSLLFAVLITLAVWNCGSGYADDPARPFYFPPPVGELGDMQKLEFEGEFTVAPTAIRHALDGSLSVTQVSRPSMQLSALLKTIDNELARGYAASGFPDAVVSTRHDADRNILVTSIEEGGQFKCRDIVVEGVESDIAQMVEKALRPGTPAPAQVRPPTGKKVEVETQAKDQNQAKWTVGKACYFGPDQTTRFEPNVTLALEEAGLVAPVFVINLVRDDEQHVVDLHVTVSKNNDLQVISEIVISGLEMNSEADVRALIDIAPGTHWMPKTQLDIAEKLRASGRFVKWDFEASRVVANSPSVQLKLKLVENIFVPPLCDELGDVSQAMLRSAEWLNRWNRGEQEFQVHIHAEEVRSLLKQLLPNDSTVERFQETPVDVKLIVAPAGNTVIRAEVGRTGDSDHAGYLISLVDGEVQFDSIHSRRSIRLRPDSAIQSRLNLNFVAPEDFVKGRRYGLTLGFGVGTSKSEHVSAVAGLSVDPAFMLNSVSDPLHSHEFVGDRLVVHQSGGITNEYDIETGRWLSGGGVVEENGRSGSIQYVFGKQLIQQELDALHSGDWDVQENAGLAELMNFVIGELQHGPLQLPSNPQMERVQRWTRLLVHIAQKVDEKQKDERPVKFHIPPSVGPGNSQMFGVAAMLSTANNAVFARKSLLWSFGRELSLLLATKDPRSLREIDSLLRHEQSGPLLQLYSTEVLALVNPQLSRISAERALRQLDSPTLAYELEAIFGPDTKCGQFLTELIHEVRTLPADERALLLEVFPEELSRKTLVTACSNPAQTDNEVVLLFAQHVWVHFVREHVQKRLYHHAPPIRQVGG
ncbi:MAG: hypothetical protein KDA69_02135 [Planctomycetaceae bacterium]|nr:hypothetical protein [Planctomycetaceae bacterium]